MSLGTKRVKCLQRHPPGDIRRDKRISPSPCPLALIVSDSDFGARWTPGARRRFCRVTVLHSFGGAAERARELLSELGIADAENMLPAELSGGMQRRVAIARLIAADKKIILLDEAFESLDEKTRDISREIIKRHCKGKTLVLVSHNADDVAALTDRSVTVNKI